MATRASLGVGIIGSTAKAVIWVALMTLALGAVGDYAFAQQPAPAQDDKVLSKSELSALVGKIALYPDDLVAIVLPASTYPLQVVEAERFLQERQKDPSLKPSDKWDDSIVALLNYPEVVKLMNNDLDWTWKLGDAVINQRGDLLDAIQSFRTEAAAAGNLKTDEHQVVQNDDQGEVSIVPADPQVVYVPYYDPQEVVVQQPTPVYYYYPYGYPLYYYPYPYGYSFAAGYFWGVTTAFVIGWHSHYVHVVHCGYPGHPYYGHTYYDGHYAHGGYYVRHDANAVVSHGNYVWEPHYRSGGQPFTRSDGRQLAIAHRDPNAGGAPSGYHSADRGTGYRPGFHDDGRSSDSHGNNGYGNGRGNDGHVGNGYGNNRGNDGHANDGHAGNGYGNGHSSDGHSNNGSGSGHGNDGHAGNGYGNGHGNDGHAGNGYGNSHGDDGHAGNGYGNGHGDSGHAGNGYGNGHGNDGHAGNGYGNGHGNDGHAGNGYGNGGNGVGANGSRDGMKQIQPIRNDPPTQAAIRNGLREHAPGQSAFSGRNAMPPSRSVYQSPNQSTSLREPAIRNSPQAPQYRNAPQAPQAPQFRNAPQTAQARNVPQAAAPQMRTMPMPSSPQMRTMTAPSGGASYTYRSPSMAMPQASTGHAPATHQGGGGSHSSQGHGGGRGSR